MKKWSFLLSVALFALLLNGTASHVAAAAKTAAAKPAPPTLVLNGNVLKPVIPPLILNATTMIPVRTVAENLKYDIGYDDKRKQVHVKSGSNDIVMTIDSKKAIVNGKSLSLHQPPTIRSARTLVPLRFVSEAFGMQVYWDNPTRSVFMIGGTTGTGTGDGGLIGVVDDEDDTDPSGGVIDGGPAPGGDNAGTVDGGSGGQPGESDGDGTGITDGNGTGTDGGTASPEPQTLNGHVLGIRYETDTVVVKYDGTMSPVTSTLTGPDRIVLDLPSADFTTDFSPTLAVTAEPWKSGEFAVQGHTALMQVRYAVNVDVPRTVRVVLDFNKPWGFELSNDTAAGEIRLKLKEPVFTVVLDAGHGGKDPGAKSVTGKWEKDFTLSVIQKVYNLLAGEKKLNVVLTRADDSYPTLDDRINLANNLHADLFLSVHGNSFNPEINGTETYYTRPESLAFAKQLHKNAVAAAGLKDNGVRTANFKVIKYTTMPAALLEVGYLSNVNDEKKLYDPAFQDRVAQAIATSIKQYFKLLPQV